jgi:hypothetical protein
MGSSSVRGYLVILAGLVIGASLIVSTVQQLRRGRRFPSASGRLHPIEALARLVLGASLVLLAVFLLAGRTLWANGAASTAPAWASLAGLVILVGMLLSGGVVGVFAAARRLRSKGR